MESVLRLVLCSVAVGGTIAVFSWICRQFWSVAISPKEAGMLAGAVIGLLVALNLKYDLPTATLVAGLIIGAYFLLKVVSKAWE